MGHKIILAGLIAVLTTAPAFADQSSKEEDIGIGLGATIGVFAGGPIGMVAGAIIGSKIGGEMNDRGEKVDELSSSLQGSRNRIEELERDIDQLDGDLHRARSESRPELLSLLQAGIEMDLLFRTDEDVLTSDTEARLQQLAASVAAMPDVYIRLDGYADERGDAEYNRKLSVRRAEHVRDVLQAGGIAAQRIDLEAHGESPAMDASIDSLALERRVSLTLFTKESPSFAANPN